MGTAKDWRSSESADYFESLDLEHLAFESISRDQHFRNDRAALLGQIEKGPIGRAEAMRGFRETWGVSFRGNRRAGSMGPAAIAERRADPADAAWLHRRPNNLPRKPAQSP